jgi:hypothetical protein
MRKECEAKGVRSEATEEFKFWGDLNSLSLWERDRLRAER